MLATELDPVVDQVREHLFEPARVCIDHHVRIYFVLQCNTLCCRLRVQRIANVLDQLMQLNRRGPKCHVPTFDRSQLQYVVYQTLHARGVLANDREETLRALSIFHRTVFECFDECEDRGQRRSQFVRDVREKLLSHMFETFGACDVEEDAERTFSAVTVDSANRNHAQIEDLSLWSMCFDFDAASFAASQAVQKRTVDRGITRQLSQAL